MNWTVIVALVGTGSVVTIAWALVAWRSYNQGDDFDLTRLNTLANSPYHFPLRLPLHLLRHRNKKQRAPKD